MAKAPIRNVMAQKAFDTRLGGIRKRGSQPHGTSWLTPTEEARVRAHLGRIVNIVERRSARNDGRNQEAKAYRRLLGHCHGIQTELDIIDGLVRTGAIAKP